MLGSHTLAEYTVPASSLPVGPMTSWETMVPHMTSYMMQPKENTSACMPAQQKFLQALQQPLQKCIVLQGQRM